MCCAALQLAVAAAAQVVSVDCVPHTCCVCCLWRRYAARKVLNVVENVERVLAIELMAACQGLDFLRPLRSTDAIERVYSLVRTRVPFWDEDMHASPLMEVCVCASAFGLWHYPCAPQC